MVSCPIVSFNPKLQVENPNAAYSGLCADPLTGRRSCAHNRSFNLLQVRSDVAKWTGFWKFWSTP